MVKLAARRVFLILSVLLLVSCNLPAYNIRRLDVRILEPSNNLVVMVGTEVMIRTYSVHQGGAANPTASFTFFANGLTIGSAPSRSGSDAAVKQADLSWTPDVAGEYQLQVEGILNDPEDDRGGVSPGVRVCVLDFPLDFFVDRAIPPYATGFNGPCAFPTPAPTDPADSSFNFTAGPQAGFFSYPTDACPDVAWPTITITARVDRDPSDQIAFFMAEVLWGGDGATFSFGGVPFVLNPSGVGASGEKVFSGSWTASEAYDGSNPLTWKVYAFARNGSLLGETSGTIEFRPCDPGAGKSDPEPTATPGSSNDCPPGTYFAETTFRCIPIDIPSNNPNPDGGDSGGDSGGGGGKCNPMTTYCGP